MKKNHDGERILQRLKKELPHLREKYGVVRIALFGSFAKGAQTESSDIDLLVELSRPLGLEFVAMAEHLEKRLGRKVDLATFETFSRSMQNPRYRSIASDIKRSLTYA